MKRITPFILAATLSIAILISCYSDTEATSPPNDNDNITEEIPFNKYQLDDMTVYKFFLSGQNYIVVRSAEGVSMTKE